MCSDHTSEHISLPPSTGPIRSHIGLDNSIQGVGLWGLYRSIHLLPAEHPSWGEQTKTALPARWVYAGLRMPTLSNPEHARPRPPTPAKHAILCLYRAPGDVLSVPRLPPNQTIPKDHTCHYSLLYHLKIWSATIFLGRNFRHLLFWNFRNSRHKSRVPHETPSHWMDGRREVRLARADQQRNDS